MRLIQLAGVNEVMIAYIPPHPAYVRLLGTEAKMTCPAGTSNSFKKLRRLVLCDVGGHEKYISMKQNVRRREKRLIRSM